MDGDVGHIPSGDRVRFGARAEPEHSLDAAPLRALFYMPVIIAPIAVATMWRWMYDPFFGLFSATLTALGLQAFIPDWLGDAHVALYFMFIAYVWQTVGFSLVLFLAGLQGVSPTLIEASRVDGAEPVSGVPICDAAGAPALDHHRPHPFDHQLAKAFDVVYGMTGGGPAQSTQMLALWAFTQSMQLGDFGQRRGDLGRPPRPDHRDRHSLPALVEDAPGGHAMTAFAQGVPARGPRPSRPASGRALARADHCGGDLDRSLRVHCLYVAEDELDGHGRKRVCSANEP